MAEHSIRTIEAFPLRVPLKARWRSDPAAGGKAVAEPVIVRVTCASGLVGVGEADGTARWSGETAIGTTAIIRAVLAPLLVGTDPFDVTAVARAMDRACKHNWFAKAAVEMACWDICGRALDKPVYSLLGGPHRPAAIRNRFSLGACSPARARELTEEMVAIGFSTFKVKVGGAVGEDLARVRAVQSALPKHGEIVIDATGGWSAGEAIEAIRALQDCSLRMVEQPTPFGDYAAMARVREETGVAIIADDSCFDLVQVQELIRNRCCEAFSVYPGKNGGISKARGIVAAAATHGLKCTVGSNMELGVATAAMGHMVRGLKHVAVETIPGDLRGPEYYDVSVTTLPIEMRGPITIVPEGPGLGVEVDWDVVRFHRMSE
jgi:L-alanine-DL-glutamate epimerase-like enolase superfamily enzyme